MTFSTNLNMNMAMPMPTMPIMPMLPPVSMNPFSGSIFGGNLPFAGMLPFNPLMNLPLIPPPVFTPFFNPMPLFGNLFKPSTNTNTSSQLSISSNKGSDYVRSQGYNSEKGQKLARSARQNSAGGFLGKCAAYVKKAIEKCGLGKYIYGVNGCDIADAYKKSGHFKEIDARGLDLKTLPAGCVLCYGKGVSRYNSRYGHTEITLGNGTAVSDGVTRNIRPGGRVLIPV